MKNYKLMGMFLFSCLVLSGCAFSLRDEPFIIGPALERRKARIEAETMTGHQILLSDKMKDANAYGKWLVFSIDSGGNEEIFKMKKNGTKLRRLTFNDCYDGKPKWVIASSAELMTTKKWILFRSDREGKEEFYIMKSNGEEQKELRHGISPNRKKMAFITGRGFFGHGAGYLFMMNPDGTNIRYIEDDVDYYHWSKSSALQYKILLGGYLSTDEWGRSKGISKEEYNKRK